MTVAAYWTFGTHGRVEVDDTGTIQVAVRAEEYDRESRADKDGFTRADVSNIDVLTGLLHKARAFVAAVFPPGPPGEFTWQERAEAYKLLEFHHKLVPGGDLARHAMTVTYFLTDAKSAAQDYPSLDDFARAWERWW